MCEATEIAAIKRVWDSNCLFGLDMPFSIQYEFAMDQMESNLTLREPSSLTLNSTCDIQVLARFCVLTTNWFMGMTCHRPQPHDVTILFKNTTKSSLKMGVHPQRWCARMIPWYSPELLELEVEGSLAAHSSHHEQRHPPKELPSSCCHHHDCLVHCFLLAGPLNYPCTGADGFIRPKKLAKSGYTILEFNPGHAKVVHTSVLGSCPAGLPCWEPFGFYNTHQKFECIWSNWIPTSFQFLLYAVKTSGSVLRLMGCKNDLLSCISSSKLGRELWCL